ncbi:MAG: ATPase [Oscillospiraceae bacterium]|jgi:F0F1-type ATP synthase membrane subunit b/b'|nr:ATPase [Oscillospiraceae bacterium]
MRIEEILEMMDDTLDKAMQVPFSNKKSLVDVEKMRELVDEIRLNMPNEFKQAKKITQDRKDIVSEAKGEADMIIKRAEERAKQLVSHQEITRHAQQRSNEIIASAHQKSKELRNTTNEYIDNTLSKVEELLSNDLVNIKKARNALKANK